MPTTQFFRRIARFAALLFLGATLSANAQGWAPVTGPVAATPAASTAMRGQATVIIFRTSSLVGGLFKPSVLDNSKELLKLRNGSYTTLTLTPGEHVMSSTLSGNEVKLDAKPGETYYLRMTLATTGQYSMFKGQLTLVNTEQAKNEMAKLKAVDGGEKK